MTVECCGPAQRGEVPPGFALVVDNVSIEIGERIAPGSVVVAIICKLYKNIKHACVQGLIMT